MNESEILLSFTLFLFSVSFTWMINERINNFPKIRRFYTIRMILKSLFLKRWNSNLSNKYIFFGTEEERKLSNKEKLSTDFKVFFPSWIIIILVIAITIPLMIKYNIFYNVDSFYKMISNRIIIPILFLILPQFVSRLISNIVLGYNPNEIKHMWFENNELFDIFSSQWKKDHYLTGDGVVHGKFIGQCKKRAKYSFIDIALIFSIIYFLIIFPY